MLTRGLAAPRWLWTVPLLFGLGCDCGSSSREASRTTAAPSASATASGGAPTASRSLCAVASKPDVSLELAALTYGDVVVLKYSTVFDDHSKVAELAMQAGALSAHPAVTGQVFGLSARGIVVRTLAALEAGVLSKLEPYLHLGRLPHAAAQMEVVLSSDDARDLDLAVGDTFRLGILPTAASEADPSLRKATLVGTLEIPSTGGLAGNHTTLWTTLSHAWAARPESGLDAATSVAIHLRPRTVAADWARDFTETLKGEAGDAYKVLTAAELQQPAMAWREDLSEFCASARPPPVQPTVPRLPLPSCADRNSGPMLRDLVRQMTGDAIAVSTDPRPIDEWSRLAWLSGGRIDRREEIVFLQGALFSNAAALPVEFHGWSVAARKRLEPYVVAGSLAGLGPQGGVAFSQVLAEMVGATVGKPIQLALRRPPSSTTETPPPLHLTQTRVAALLRFPAETIVAPSIIAWVDRAYAAQTHPTIGRGKTNAALLWTKPPVGSSFATDLGPPFPPGFVVADSARPNFEITAKALSVLRTACR